MDYENLSRDELLVHVRSYAESIHKLANECLILRGTLATRERDLAAHMVGTGTCGLCASLFHRDGSAVLSTPEIDRSGRRGSKDPDGRSHPVGGIQSGEARGICDGAGLV